MSFMQKILDKFRLKDTIYTGSNELVISHYSDMPRYYTINGTKYDIDDPDSIYEIPVFSATFFIHNKEYGMDSVLRKHSSQLYLKNKDIYNACQYKLQEYKEANINFQTEDEKEWKKERQEIEEKRRREELEKRKLHDSFRIEDMYQFPDIPFEWQWVMQLNHTNGIAWFMLNMNNQYIALSAIDFINSILEESKNYTGFKETLYVCTENIDFSYPVPMQKDSMTNTFVECIPYTKTGKISKYPAALHFREKPEISIIGGTKFPVYTVRGSIYFMRDGNIGKADIYIKEYWIQIRLKGINLVVQRIGKNTPAGNEDIYRQKL